MGRLAWRSLLLLFLIATSCTASPSSSAQAETPGPAGSTGPAETRPSGQDQLLYQDQPSEPILVAPELLGLPYSQARDVATEASLRVVGIPSAFDPDPVVAWQIPEPDEISMADEVIIVGIALPEPPRDLSALQSTRAQEEVSHLGDSLRDRDGYVATEIGGDGTLIVSITADAEIGSYQDILDELAIPTKLDICQYTTKQLEEMMARVASVLAAHDGPHSYGYAANPCGVRVGLCVAGISVDECAETTDEIRQILWALPAGISLAVLG